jgi:hypothetical protein
LSDLQGINFSGLQSLQGLSGVDFNGLAGENFSGLSGLNFSGLGNFNLTGVIGGVGGAAGAGGGPGGGPPYVVVCDQACLDAKLIAKAENDIVPRPPAIAAITQAQLNKRRMAIEARTKAQVAQQAKIAKQKFRIQQEKLRAEAAGSGGGSPSGPKTPTGGCFAGESPLPTSDPSNYGDVSGFVQDAINAAHNPPAEPAPPGSGPPSALTHHYPGPAVGPTATPGFDVGPVVVTAIIAALALQKLRQWWRGLWGC